MESTKTPVGGSGNDGAYVEVKKADVPDPSASASLVFDKFYGVKSQKPWVMFETVQPRDTTGESGDTKYDTWDRIEKLNRQMSRLNHQNLKRLQ